MKKPTIRRATIGDHVFRLGDRVVVDVPGFGGVFQDDGSEEEVHYEPGALGVIDRFDQYDNDQELAVTIVMDCGVVNVFDATDDPLYPFEHAPADAPPAPEEPDVVAALVEALAAAVEREGPQYDSTANAHITPPSWLVKAHAALALAGAPVAPRPAPEPYVDTRPVHPAYGKATTGRAHEVDGVAFYSYRRGINLYLRADPSARVSVYDELFRNGNLKGHRVTVDGHPLSHFDPGAKDVFKTFAEAARAGLAVAAREGA